MLNDPQFKEYFFHIAPLWVLELSYKEYLQVRSLSTANNGKPKTNLISKQEILDFSNSIRDGWYTNPK